MRCACILLALVPALALAQWDGYPVADASTNYLTWQEYDAAYGEHPFSQLVSALHERQTAAGLALLSIAHSTDVGQVTNPIATTVTNTWGWFTNSGNSCYENMTHQDIVDFDVALAAAIPLFCDTNYAATNMVYPIPMWTMTNIFLDHGIGHVRGSIAEFTRQPSSVIEWVLAESVYTGAWSTVSVDDFAASYYALYRPVIWYNAVGTTPTSGTAVVTGDILYQPGQGIAAGTEVVTITGEYTPLTSAWYSVDSVTNSSGSTNDIMQVRYTNAIAIYSGQPYDLSHELFDERYTVLNSMVATQTNSLETRRENRAYVIYGTYDDGTHSWRGVTNKAYPYSLGYVYPSQVEAFYDAMVAEASAFFASPSTTSSVVNPSGFEVKADYATALGTGGNSTNRRMKVTAYAEDWIVANAPVPTNYSHSFEGFAIATNPGGYEYYDHHGFGATNGELFILTNYGATASAVVTSSWNITVDPTMAFPSDAGTNDNEWHQSVLDNGSGYPPVWRVWWNVTGGFLYK